MNLGMKIVQVNCTTEKLLLGIMTEIEQKYVNIFVFAFRSAKKLCRFYLDKYTGIL